MSHVQRKWLTTPSMGAKMTYTITPNAIVWKFLERFICAHTWMVNYGDFSDKAQFERYFGAERYICIYCGKKGYFKNIPISYHP